MRELTQSHKDLLESLEAKREEEVQKVLANPGIANAIAGLDETIARVREGRLCCRECGSERIVAWYPEYHRQGIELYREPDGSVSYDYTGEDYDSADDAGEDEEYWCLECKAHSHDIAYLVCARDVELVTMTDTHAIGSLVGILDGREWEPDTVDAIASTLRSAGHTIREPYHEWETAELEAERERILHPPFNPNRNPSTLNDYERECVELIDAALDERG